MTQDDQAMLTFALKWYRFGGGDEYIFPEFGITPRVFYQRVLALATYTSDGVDGRTRKALIGFCSSKLGRAAART